MTLTDVHEIGTKILENIKEFNSILPRHLEFYGEIPYKWEKFKEKFMSYLEANGHINESEMRKVGLLLYLMGDKAFHVYDKFTYADGEPAINLKNTLAKFDALYSKPFDSVVYHRFKFFSRSQMKKESVDRYVNALKSLAEPCEFGDEMLNLIRDQFVLGIKDKQLQECLIRHPQLKLNTALDICRIHKAWKKGKFQDMDGELLMSVLKILREDELKEREKLKAERIKCSRCGFPRLFGKCNELGCFPRPCKTNTKRDDTKEVKEEDLKREVWGEEDSKYEEESGDKVLELVIQRGEEDEDRDMVLRRTDEDINVKWKGNILPDDSLLFKINPTCNFKLVPKTVYD